MPSSNKNRPPAFKRLRKYKKQRRHCFSSVTALLFAGSFCLFFDLLNIFLIVFFCTFFNTRIQLYNAIIPDQSEEKSRWLR